MALSADEQTQLAQLQARYDALIGGTNPTLIQEGVSKTEFGAGDPVALKARIDQLLAKAASPTGRSRGAISFRVGSRYRY